jgi:hypothetical protein
MEDNKKYIQKQGEDHREILELKEKIEVLTKNEFL